MRVILNNILPLDGFTAMNVYGTLFCRRIPGNSTLNHESIHTAQMKDFCEWIPIGGTIFYIVYFLEWLFRLVTNPTNAYRSISFEKEAKAHENEPEYLSTRRHFAMWRKK